MALPGVARTGIRALLRLGRSYTRRARRARSEFVEALLGTGADDAAAEIDRLRISGEYVEAMSAAERALAAWPDDLAVLGAARWVFLDCDHYEASLDTCVRRLELDSDDPDGWHLRVVLLCLLARYDEAEEALAEFARQPYSTDYHLAANWLASQQGRFDDALEELDDGMLLAGMGDHRMMASKLDLLCRLWRLDDADDLVDNTEADDLDDAELQVSIGRLHAQRQRYDRARASYQRALELDPDNSSAYAGLVGLGRTTYRYDTAELDAEAALRRTPTAVDAVVEVAWLYQQTGRADAALTELDRHLAVRPRETALVQAKAGILRVMDRFAEAEECADRLLAQAPYATDVLLERGLSRLLRGRPDLGLGDFDEILRLRPFDADGWEWRSTTLRNLRRVGEAEACVRQALARLPDEPSLHLELAWTLIDVDRDDEALACVDAALSLDSTSVSALRCRTQILRTAGRYAEAEQAAQEALLLRPEDPELLVALADVYADTDRGTLALQMFERALAVDPANPLALQWRGTMLRWLDRFDAAEDALRVALERRSNDNGLLVELGRLYDERRDYPEALACYEEVLRRAPDDVDGQIARSVTLRTVHRGNEALAEIERLSRERPWESALRLELGWIHHDAGQLDQARRIFVAELEIALNVWEHGAARHGLGWVAYAEGRYPAAETEFRRALTDRPTDPYFLLALAWSLARQDRPDGWVEAETVARSLVTRWVDAFAVVCLGVLAYRQDRIASAEYHMKRALEMDPRRGSHADLGALYAQIGRWDEAETQLLKAIEVDPYDARAHLELGALFLELGDERVREAEAQFRQAVAIDRRSGPAAIGLAQVLTRLGEEADAEQVLRRVLRRKDITEEWRIQLALARLLVQRGDKQQNADLHAEAYSHAQRAIGSSPDTEADPHFVAGVARHRLGLLAAEAGRRAGYRVRAMQHLRECLKRDPGHADAERSLQLLEREAKAARPAIVGGFAVAVISLALLTTMWIAFFLGDRVTPVMLTATTPVLVGLFTVAALLPALLRLKLPGFEADLQPGSGSIAAGPTGDVSFGPGRFVASTGPTGRLPRRE